MLRLRPSLLQRRRMVGHVAAAFSVASWPLGGGQASSRTVGKKRELPADGPDLADFLLQAHQEEGGVGETPPLAAGAEEDVPYLAQQMRDSGNYGEGRRVFVETYGCQMNVSDTEIVQGILCSSGFERASSLEEADVVLLNTCAIRDKAEQKIWHRLEELKGTNKKLKRQQVVGVLGCMAERLKNKLLDGEKQLCQVVVGPDAYKDLPRLLTNISSADDKAINVLLSQDETYADVTPVRVAANKVSAFVSIMRGCNNMCSYCIVPFTRGRERSRDVESILEEVRALSREGYREVVLLGQNVNSYNDLQTPSERPVEMAEGFRSIVRVPEGGVRFAELLERVSAVDPEMRIRFTSPHPKDFPDDVLRLIRDRPNVCSHLHMPAQSGNSQVLEAMRRGYSRDAYLRLIDRVREFIPHCALSSDFIAGFCGESDEAHADTLSLMRIVDFDMAYMFAYSLREKTRAHRRLSDDVPEEVKLQRLRDLQSFFYDRIKEKTKSMTSRRSDDHWVGRTDGNYKVVFPKEMVPPSLQEAKRTTANDTVALQLGDYVAVTVDAPGLTLQGTPIARTTMTEFFG